MCKEMDKIVKDLIKDKEFYKSLEKLGLKVSSKLEEYEVVADYEYMVGYVSKAQKVLRLSKERAYEFDKLSKEEKYERLDMYGEVKVKKFKVEDVGDLGNLYIREV